MKKLKIILFLILFTGSAMAQCSKKIDREFIFSFNHPPYDVERLEKIYETCQKPYIKMLIYSAKGDRFEANGEVEFAYYKYIKARSIYAEIQGVKLYKNWFLLLNKKIKKYAPKTANEITHGAVEKIVSRGGKMISEYSIENLPLNFRSDSSVVDVKGVNHEQVEAIYEALLDKKYKGKVIKIKGFTDTTGSALHNLGLSERRAEALKTYLKSRGLKNYISSQGQGESQPICIEGVLVRKKNHECVCSQKEDKYRSRRVTISIRSE